MMVTIAQQFAYAAYGFKINSDFPHSGFTPREKDEDGADINVSIGDLSSFWGERPSPDDRWVCKENFVMFQIPDIATYLIMNGNQIIVSPCEGASPVKVRLFLDGYCMAAILLQRKIVPLHGSAVVINGKAYAIIGRSGAGKSTLTRALLERGYAFLCDDVIPVRIDRESGEILVSPAFPEQKLWQESLDGFGMESAMYDPIYQKERSHELEGETEVKTKFAIPVSKYASSPMPLGGILELVKTDHEAAGPSLLTKNEQLRAVTHHTFNQSMVADLGVLDWYFKATVELVNRVEVTKVNRSKTSFSANELASSILEFIRQERL